MVRRVLKVAGIALATLVVATVALVIFVEPEEESTTRPQPPQGEIRVGQPVVLNGIAYVVTKARKTRTFDADPESDYVARAEGVFVVVSITWRNVSDDPTGSTYTEPMLIGGNGKRYGLDHGTSDNTFAYELQPDFSEKGTLVFDVTPAAAKGARIRFEDCEVDFTSEDLQGDCDEAVIDLGL